jgi:hypothetical protein
MKKASKHQINILILEVDYVRYMNTLVYLFVRYFYCFDQINEKFWEERIAYFPWHDTGHTENDASNNSSIVTCVFVTAVTFLPSRFLATIGGLLLNRCLATIWVDTHTHTATWSHKPTLFFKNKENRLKIKHSIIIYWKHKHTIITHN